jgi:acetyl esterase
MLDPQARALIDLMIKRGVPPTHTMTPTEARNFYRDRRGFTQPEPPALGDVRDLRTDASLALRLYKPLNASTTVLSWRRLDHW